MHQHHLLLLLHRFPSSCNKEEEDKREALNKILLRLFLFSASSVKMCPKLSFSVNFKSKFLVRGVEKHWLLTDESDD